MIFYFIAGLVTGIATTFALYMCFTDFKEEREFRKRSIEKRLLSRCENAYNTGLELGKRKAERDFVLKIKADIEMQIERDFKFSETESVKVPLHYGTANGLQVALHIIDSRYYVENEKDFNELYGETIRKVIKTNEP